MPVKIIWKFFFVYSWDFNRGEINGIENELYEENEQDENDTADEYLITYVNECNTHDEPEWRPATSYPTYDLPDEWMAKEIHDSDNACARQWEGKDFSPFKENAAWTARTMDAVS